MDSNYVRIVDPDKPGDYLVLFRRDMTEKDVLFDEARHGVKALAAKKDAADKAAADAAAKKASAAPKPEPPTPAAPAPPAAAKK